MDIIKILKNYSNIKAQITILESRIKYLETLLLLDDLTDLHYIQQKNTRKALYSNPTQTQALHNDSTYQEIKAEIQRNKSMLEYKKHKFNILESSINMLNDEELYIIKLRYFNKMRWEHIKINFSAQKRNLEIKSIKEIHRKSINKLNNAINELEFLSLEFCT